MGEVHALPVPEPEPYLTRQQLAALMGVHVTTIDRMVKQGMPSETWGLRSRRFRASTAIAWARERSAA
jgi:excisionase family DNA binding protein